MTKTKDTPHAALSICCRPLVEAFRRDAAAQSEAAALLVSFDESGAPFYRFTRQHAGQTLSAPALPLVFCPFCGHEVAGAGAGSRATSLAARTYDEDEEVTLIALDGTLELETLIAERTRNSGEVAASL